MIAAAAAACLPEETPASGDERVTEVEQTILDEGDAAGPITQGAFPWLVFVGSGAGALVASNVVLTAAHVVDANYPQYVDEPLGSTHVPFSGDASVFIVSSSQVPSSVSQAVAKMALAGQVGPAVAHPTFAGGEAGTDDRERGAHPDRPRDRGQLLRRRRGVLLMGARVVLAAGLALALAACGDAPSDPAAAGGAGGVGETSSTTAGPGPVAVSASSSTAGSGASTGTGGGNPDDPYGCLQGAAPPRPSSIPEGYRPWACWSQKPQCMLWIPEDPATMVDRLEWGPCAPGSPGGDGCRQMLRPWWTDAFGIGATFPAVPELDTSGDTPLLRLARESRDDANLGDWWVEWDVYELDGPARFAMRRPYKQGVECGYQDYDLTEGYWVLAAIELVEEDDAS